MSFLLSLTMVLGLGQTESGVPVRVITLEEDAGSYLVTANAKLSLADTVRFAWVYEGDRVPKVEWDRALVGPGWTVVEELPLSVSKTAKGHHVTKSFALAPNALGDVPLQLVPFKMRFEDEPWRTVTTPALAYKVETTILDAMLAVPRDITGIECLPNPDRRSVPYWPWTLVGLAVLTAVCAFLWFRPRRLPGESPQARALRELDWLENRLATRPSRSRAAAYLLQRIVRRYLSSLWGMTVDMCTKRELVDRIEQDPRVSELDRAFLREFFGVTDLAKYSGPEPTPFDLRKWTDAVRKWMTESVRVRA